MRIPSCTMDILVAVVVTAESNTKAEAAGRLGITISALDKRLNTASAMLGVRLLYQGESGMDLTEEGRIFHSAALRSIEFALLAEESTRAYVLLKMKHLLLGHSTYLAPQLLGLIRRLKLVEHPGVRLEHKTGLTSSIAQRVTEGTLHAGFSFLPLKAPELVIWKILEEPLVVCIPEAYPWSSRSVIRGEDLHEQPAIAVAREAIPALHQEIEEYLGSVGVKLHVVADAFTPSEALVLVEQRVGICLLARSSAAAHRGVAVRPLWTHGIMRQSGFFFREDSRSPLVLELSRIVLQQTEKLRRP